MDTYTAELFGQTFTITSDFRDPCHPVTGDVPPGMQAADYGCDPAKAMYDAILYEFECTGEDIRDYHYEIDEAIDEMTHQ